MIPRYGMWWMMLIPLLMLTGAVLACVLAVWRAVKPPRSSSAEPACERCKYRVAGLAALTCPECGTDLLRTGIITRPMEMRRRGSVLGAVAAWTILMTMGSYIASIAGFSAGGAVFSSMPSTATTTLTPSSGAFKSVDITNDYSGVAASMPIVVVLHLNDGTDRTIDLSPSLSSYSMKPENGEQSVDGTLDDGTLPMWFAKAGLAFDSAALGKEISDVQRAVDIVSAGGWSNLSTVKFRSLKAGAPIFPVAPARNASSDVGKWAFIVGGLALWIFGIVAIILRRRFLLREADRADSPPAMVGTGQEAAA